MGMIAKIRQMYFRDKVALREIAWQTGLSRNTLSTSCAGARCANLLYCTSDHKTSPIQRELRRYLKANPRFGGRLVNAMGKRAEESAARAQKIPWRRNDRMSVAGREVFDWLPIFDLSVDDVFRVIRNAGQSPHGAYAAGMSRLRCSFCILASRADLRLAAELRPGLYARYVDLERRIGHTLSPSRVPLPQLTGIPL